MKSKPFSRYYLLSCLGMVVASYYPLSMGIRVITDMIANGTVMKENYPKYIIPYTPISIAIIIGVLLMPLFIKIFKKFALAGGSIVSTGVFFATELLFEQKVVVSTAETVTKLEDWQMFMCYVPPEGWGETVTTYKTQTAVDILMGDYNPAFKLHFYVISIVLILTVLNCLYGFGQMIKNNDKTRCKSLILQSVCSAVFLGLCILACFTAFWRDGSIQVSVLSAALMTLFFITFGITAGIFVGSFLLGKRKILSVLIPAITASAMTLLMYIGEMILLNGHLYSLGSGFLFNGLPGIVFAPIDLLVVLFSGCITAMIFGLLNKEHRSKALVIALAGTCTVIMLVLALGLGMGGLSEKDSSITNVGGVDGPQRVYSVVRLVNKESDKTESSYEVSANLPSTDFSSIGKTLEDKITAEWETYSGMTETQRLASSHLWGLVGIQTDTWVECEEATGITVDNPLEAMEWLTKTGYFGDESSDPAITVKHIQISANAVQTASNIDGKLHQLSIDAGYTTGTVKVTLSATLSSNVGAYTTGGVTNGYATFEEETLTTGSGVPVLVITADEENNNGYYNGDYYDPTAYLVKDNVFYTIRVFGDEADKEDIREVLEKILAEM